MRTDEIFTPGRFRQKTENKKKNWQFNYLFIYFLLCGVTDCLYAFTLERDKTFAVACSNKMKLKTKDAEAKSFRINF